MIRFAFISLLITNITLKKKDHITRVCGLHTNIHRIWFRDWKTSEKFFQEQALLVPGSSMQLRGDYTVLGFGCFPSVRFLIDQIEIPKVWQRKLLIALDGPIFGLAAQAYNVGGGAF